MSIHELRREVEQLAAAVDEAEPKRIRAATKYRLANGTERLDSRCTEDDWDQADIKITVRFVEPD